MASLRPMPTLAFLRQRYQYDPDTGAFTWAIDSPNGQRFCGDIAGGVRDKHGHRIKIGSGVYKVARLAWFMATEQDPAGFHVDHINGDIYDNRLENLRLVTYSQNQANSTAFREGRSLPKGVYRQGAKYRAMLKNQGKNIYLGTFDTPQEARAAYMARAKDLWGEYATDRSTPSYYRLPARHIKEIKSND